MIISGPTIYTEHAVLSNSSLIIDDRSIAKIIHHPTSHADFEFPDTYHLVPGFIDLHVHGANRFDVMDATPEALIGISQALAKEGTTAFLATTMTAATESIEKALIAVQQTKDHPELGARLLGVHLEGPFIAKNKAGAQCIDHAIIPDIALIDHWQTLTQDIIKLVTLAPELPESIAFIRELKKRSIIAAMGHTHATYQEAMTAINEGCHYATHIFNAMRSIHQREPGVVSAALLSDAVFTEVIADGIHLHPAIIKLILKLKTADKMILVTDAMRAKCLGDGQYDLGGQTVTVKNNIARLADDTLAGSLLTLSAALANMLQFVDCDLASIIKMTSSNPAKVLGLFDKKGSIITGKDADLVVLDDQYNVVLTVTEGRLTYQTSATNSASLIS